MKTQTRKLLSLNLVLLLLIALSLPVSAANADSGEPYFIRVGSTSFYSDTDASGTGWAYDAETNSLTLDNYVGPSISASGDLVVYSYGTSAILGSDGTYYGGDGVNVAGDLSLFLFGDELNIFGGSGPRQGGDGIYVSSNFICGIYGSELNILGGNTGNSIGTDGYGLTGGYAIHAGSYALISGPGSLWAMGGHAGTNDDYTVYGSVGGCAVMAY